jgi:hypothetical protein
MNEEYELILKICKNQRDSAANDFLFKLLKTIFQIKATNKQENSISTFSENIFLKTIHLKRIRIILVI